MKCLFNGNSLHYKYMYMVHVLCTVVPNAIFTSLHGPAGACIPVALPIQCVLKHCGVQIPYVW